MGYPPQPPQAKHHVRFYVLMSTLVIAGIFFILFLNDGDGLTSFTVKDFATGATAGEGNGAIEEEFPEEQKSANEVGISLSFDRVPTVQKEAKIKDIELSFDDLTTKVRINDERLELSNLKHVTLRVKGFVGSIDFSSQGASIDGTARSIAVNNVTLSSKGTMKISFDNLDYETLSIGELELTDLELETGDGTLKVEEKLLYTLEQDNVKMEYFNGRLFIDRGLDTRVDLEGVARGIAVSGALLNFNVR